ncbi:hypothetical protein Tco_0284870 [Tanacetum coccineum]
MKLETKMKEEEEEEPKMKGSKEAPKKGPNYEFLSYAVSNSDSDLESTARSGPKCAENQRVKFAASSFVNKALTWWNTQVQARGCEAATALKAGILTDEAVSCGTLMKGNEKRKGVEETSKPGGSWKDNKKAKVGIGFVATAPPRNEFVGPYPKCVKCYSYHPKNRPCRLCYNYQKPGHFAKDCRAPFKQVAPVNVVRMGYNQRVCYECCSPDHLRNTYPKMKRAPSQAGYQPSVTRRLLYGGELLKRRVVTKQRVAYQRFEQKLWFKTENCGSSAVDDTMRIIMEGQFQRINARGNGVAGNVGGHIARECPRPKRLQDSDYFKDKMLLMQAQESGAVLDEEQSLFLAGEQVTNVDDDVDDSPENDLALNVDRVFEADECDAFDSDVDEDEHHEVHEMQTDEQHNYVVDSDADYTSNSNIIPYVEDNEDHVVQRNVSSVRNDALMSILDEMHEQGVQSRLANKPDMIINDSVASELARYKELVREYEKRAKFELTDRERKIDEQMRKLFISDQTERNFFQNQNFIFSNKYYLVLPCGHYKSKTEEYSFEKAFKQKEDKFLEVVLDRKRLKDKIKDRFTNRISLFIPVHLLV